MSKFNRSKVMPRYFAIAVVLTLVGTAILGKTLYVMTAKKTYWTKVASRLVREDDTVTAARGNILSCDGQLMAISIPQYIVYMDFQPDKMKDPKWAHEYDSLWTAQIDNTCEGLHKIFPSQSAAEFRAHLEAGRNKIIVSKKTGEQTKGARYWKIWKRRVDYNTYLKVKALPPRVVSMRSRSTPAAIPSGRWPSVLSATSARTRCATPMAVSSRRTAPASVSNWPATPCCAARPASSAVRRC